jgi:hypothetical protein
MIRINMRWLTLALAAVMLFPIFARAASGQDLSNKDRRLSVAVVGFEFNEAAAKDALADGADINAKNGAMKGETLLIAAIKGFKEPKVIKFLLDNGADPNLKDESGRTALSYARQYNIGRNQAGREILKMLEAATGQAATPAAGNDGSNVKPATGAKQGTPTTAQTTETTAAAKPKTPRRGSGPPTVDEVKETMEKSFTGIYQNHFFGVKNEVTFEWFGPISIGALQSIPSAPKPCYPVKLKVTVTAKDPRDGNTSRVARGQEANIGGFLKNELFCFYRDGFGEWDYGTYER